MLNELAYNLESFNPAFTAVLLKVRRAQTEVGLRSGTVGWQQAIAGPQAPAPMRMRAHPRQGWAPSYLITTKGTGFPDSHPVLCHPTGAEQHRAQRLRAAGHGAGGAHPAPRRRVRHAQRPAAGCARRPHLPPAGAASVTRQLVTTGAPSTSSRGVT